MTTSALAEPSTERARTVAELDRDLDKAVKLVVSLLMATTDEYAKLVIDGKLDEDVFIETQGNVQASVEALMTTGVVRPGQRDTYGLQDGDPFMVGAFEALEALIDRIHEKQQEQKNGNQ